MVLVSGARLAEIWEVFLLGGAQGSERAERAVKVDVGLEVAGGDVLGGGRDAFACNA